LNALERAAWTSLDINHVVAFQAEVNPEV